MEIDKYNMSHGWDEGLKHMITSIYAEKVFKKLNVHSKNSQWIMER